MRKGRLPEAAGTPATWTMTDMVSNDEQPADDRAAGAAVLSMRASPASPPPMASAPVSPMKMRAGVGVPPEEPRGRAHQGMAADTTARSRAFGIW